MDGSNHPKRHSALPNLILISSCGFPEIENFNHLRDYFRILSDKMETRLCGEILISVAGLQYIPRLFTKKYEFIKQAGNELVTRGSVRSETMEKISKLLMLAEDYRNMVMRVSTVA